MEEKSGKFKGVFAKFRIVELSPAFVDFLADEERVVDLQAFADSGEFQQEIGAFKAIISEFGTCFIKFEETAPKDMKNWVHNLACYNTQDVFTLLKNSIVLGEKIFAK